MLLKPRLLTRNQNYAPGHICSVHFSCHGLCDRERADDVDVDDLPKYIERVIASIAFARDACAGDQATKGISELIPDRVEDAGDAVCIGNI